RCVTLAWLASCTTLTKRSWTRPSAWSASPASADATPSWPPRHSTPDSLASSHRTGTSTPYLRCNARPHGRWDSPECVGSTLPLRGPPGSRIGHGKPSKQRSRSGHGRAEYRPTPRLGDRCLPEHPVAVVHHDRLPRRNPSQRLVQERIQMPAVVPHFQRHQADVSTHLHSQLPPLAWVEVPVEPGELIGGDLGDREQFLGADHHAVLLRVHLQHVPRPAVLGRTVRSEERRVGNGGERGRRTERSE